LSEYIREASDADAHRSPGTETLADTPLLSPAARGGYIDGERFRYHEWSPALSAAGITHRRVYDTRHTFASWAIAGAVQLFYLARIMGTSVAEIDATYGHLLPDSGDYLRGLLDESDAAMAAEGGR
jgi:integrase